MTAPPNRLPQLIRDRSGVAAIEFAMAMPFILVLGLWGAEIANLALVHMKIGQLAMHLADNASRIGDTSMLNNRKIYESDINDLIVGADMHGTSLSFYERGRAIISSLEVSSGGQQYIHWQRCKGKKVVTSDYGKQGDAVAVGMGPVGEEVIASPGEAVIFVEVTYDYQPLVSDKFFGPTKIKAVESFIVRSSRDLSGAGIFQRNPMKPDPVSDCGTYSGVPTVNL